MRSFKDMDNVLDIRAEEALAALFQPDTVAPAEYFEIYERKAALEPEQKLMSAVLEDAIGCSKTLSVQRTTGQKKWFWKRRNGLTRRRGDILLREYL